MYQDYNIEGLTKNLAKTLRIQDWDITVATCNGRDMAEKYDEFTDTKGFCERHRKISHALIMLNTDNMESDEDWFFTLVHEMYHIVTDEFIYKVRYMISMEESLEKMDSDITTHYERLVNNLTKGVLNMLGHEKFLEQFRIVDENG